MVPKVEWNIIDELGNRDDVNRRVAASALDAKKQLSLLFAIPDHPWYLDGGMAAVRIAMTVGVAGKVDGDLFKVIDSQRTTAQGGDALLSAETRKIQANLSIGADLDQAKSLISNEGLSSRGMALHGVRLHKGTESPTGILVTA